MTGKADVSMRKIRLSPVCILFKIESCVYFIYNVAYACIYSYVYFSVLYILPFAIDKVITKYTQLLDDVRSLKVAEIFRAATVIKFVE
jgi:hypothetical protein